MALIFDKEQAKAIETLETSVVLTAGAGCGKTGTLTGKFIRAIQSGIEPGKIAVLTFTNKAAAELRERIRTECMVFATSANSESEIDWKQIALCIDGVIISTYHSFYEELCREFSEELGLDPEFRLLDPRIAHGLLLQAARTAVRNRLSRLDDTLIEYAARHRLEKLIEELCELVEKNHEAKLDEIVSLSPEQLISKWKRQAKPFVTNLFNNYLKIVMQIAGASRSDLNKNQKDKLALLDEVIISSDENNPGLFFSKVHEAIGRLRPTGEILNQLFEEYHKIRKEDSFELLDSDDALIQLAANETCLMAMLALDTRESYLNCKKARRAVDFNDLMDLAERLSQLSPNNRDSIQDRFRLLLVDEFQDTDARQARILRNLAGNNFSNGGLFVVGDSRQAIYRFRGARPEELDDLRNDMLESGRQSLVHNYRSRRQIIRFVNHLAQELYYGMPPLEAGVKNIHSQEDGPQFIKFHWSLFLNDAVNQAKSLANPDIHAEARNLAKLIRETIDSPTLVGSRTGRMRPLQPGDIVFLSRSRTHWNIYERALREVNLDSHLDSSSGLFSRQEVRDLVNLLSLVENPSDDLLLTAVLRGPFGAISDESLFQLSQKEAGYSISQAFWQTDFSDFPEAATVDTDAMDGLRVLLRKLSRAKTELPPSQVVELAIELTAYDEMLKAISFRGSQPVQNLDVLVNDARSFDHDTDFGWPAMIRQWNSDLEGGKLNEAVAEPPGNMIRFLTIHSAKGLQFPVVVLVGVNGKDQVDQTSWKIHPELGLVTKSRSSDTDESDTNQNHLAWVLATQESKKSEAREVDNLLYVAVTRAEDYLIISASFKLKEMNQEIKATGEMLERIERVFRLDSGELVKPDQVSPVVTVIKNQNST